MIPVDFPEANGSLGPPKGMANCVPLPCFRDGYHVVSCWELSEEELADLCKTRRLYLMVFGGHTQPPVSLQTAPPFVYEKPAPPPEPPPEIDTSNREHPGGMMGRTPEGTRIRASLRRVTFVDHCASSFTRFRSCFERGVDLPESEPDHRGAGEELRWDDEPAADEMADEGSIGG